jgi:hypothetical protein
MTQGAVPIQVHDGVIYNSSDCYMPSPRLEGYDIETDVSPPVSPSGEEIIGFEDYDPDEIGQFTTVTVSGIVPDTGLLYVTIHLDYGLEGRDPDGDGIPNLYDKSGNGDAVDPEIQSNVLIANAWPYVFSANDGGTFAATYTVENFNEFKKFLGFAGMVLNDGSPEPGTQVVITDPEGTEISVLNLALGGVILNENGLFTDEDGFYTLGWKHTGRQAFYTVQLVGLPEDVEPLTYEIDQDGVQACPDLDCEVSVPLGRGTKFVVVDFTVGPPTP